MKSYVSPMSGIILKEFLRFSFFAFIVITLFACDKKQIEDQATFDSQIDSLVRHSQWVLFKDYQEAEKSATKALTLSKLTNNKETKSKAFKALAAVYNQKGQYQSALHHIDSAIYISKECEDSFIKTENYQLKGYIYFSKSQFDSAYYWYMKALPSLENSSHQTELGNLYSKIGRVYYNKREYDLALSYYNKALEITKKIGDEKSIARDLNNIASVYELQSKYKEALTYFQEALKINLKAERKEWIAINYHNIAKIYSGANHQDSASFYFLKALEIDRILGNKSNIADDLYSIGIFYKDLGKYEKAIPYLLESESLSHEAKNLANLCRVSEALSNCYSNIGDHKAAIKNYKNFHQLSDTLFNSTSSRRIIEMELQYQYDLEQSAISIQQQSRIIILLASIGGLLLLALLMTILYSRSKVREKKNLLRQNKLQEKLSHSESKLITNIMLLSEKNETLEQILSLLNTLNLQLRKQDQEEMNKILKTIKHHMNDDIWKEFEIRFREVNGAFYNKLNQIHPDLSPNETRLCAFLKLNMSTKEIASITHQSPKSINVARSRLRKKLNITHTDTNIFQYLSDL